MNSYSCTYILYTRGLQTVRHTLRIVIFLSSLWYQSNPVAKIQAKKTKQDSNWRAQLITVIEFVSAFENPLCSLCTRTKTHSRTKWTKQRLTHGSSFCMRLEDHNARQFPLHLQTRVHCSSYTGLSCTAEICERTVKCTDQGF